MKILNESSIDYTIPEMEVTGGGGRGGGGGGGKETGRKSKRKSSRKRNRSQHLGSKAEGGKRGSQTQELNLVAARCHWQAKKEKKKPPEAGEIRRRGSGGGRRN